MKMDKEIALHAIEVSLARGSGTPCTWRDDRDVYIEEKSGELRASVIEPVQVQVANSSFVSEVTSELQDRSLFAIAHSGNSWLVFSPDSFDFALAFGDTENDLAFCGFYSSDALAEWLG